MGGPHEHGFRSGTLTERGGRATWGGAVVLGGGDQAFKSGAPLKKGKKMSKKKKELPRRRHLTACLKIDNLPSGVPQVIQNKSFRQKNETVKKKTSSRDRYFCNPRPSRGGTPKGGGAVRGGTGYGVK